MRIVINLAQVRRATLRSIPIILLILLGIFSPFVPEAIGAVFACISIILMPLLMGNVILHFGSRILPDFFLRMGILIRMVLSWVVGAFFMLVLTYLFYAIGATNYLFIMAVVFALVCAELFNPNDLVSSILSSLKNNGGERPNRAVLLEFIVLVLIGISSVIAFRLFQPYPTYLTSEFSYIQKPLQFIDASSSIRMAENGVYPIVSVLFSLGAYFINVHPLPIIWVFAFFQSIVIAAGIYYTSKLFFKSRIASFIAAFLAMWVFGGASYQNNPYVVSNANLQYVVFILAILLVSKNMHTNGEKLSKKNWLVILCVPAIIFIQRLVIGYGSLQITAIVLTVPLLTFILAWRGLFGKSNYFAIALFIMFSMITIIHPFMAPLCLLTLCAFIISGDLIREIKLRKLRINISNGLEKKISTEIIFSLKYMLVIFIIILAILIYVIQATGILNFQNHFVLSHYLLANTYDGEIGVDVSFSEKTLFLTRGNPSAVLLFFLFGALIGVTRSLHNKTLDMTIVGAAAMGFILYFFPESFFARARYIIPFFVLCIAGGLAWLLSISGSDKLSLNSSLRKKLMTSFVLLLCGIIMVQSTTPIVTNLVPLINSNSTFSTFEPYEYEAGKWLSKNIQNQTSNVTILSDPYTINIMSGLTNINPPYKKEWVDTSEYTSASLSTMNQIKEVLNSNNFTATLKAFLKQINCSVAYIIVNGRTTKWLNQNQNSTNQFVYSTNGIPWSVNKYYVEKLSMLSSGFTPIYAVSEKVYIFRFDVSDLDLSHSNAEAVANLYTAMTFEADNAYSFATSNNYLFSFWNVTSNRRSSITSSYMAMAPLWTYIVSGNPDYLKWAENSLNFLYVNSSYAGLIVPFDVYNQVRLLNNSVKIDYSLRFIGAAINAYEITKNSTYLQMAKFGIDGLLAVYTNQTTGLPKGDQYNPIIKKLNAGCSTVYFGDYMTLLYKMYQLTNNATYNTIVLNGLDHLASLQEESPTSLITEGLWPSGQPIGYVTVNPADFISGFSEFYILTKNPTALNLMETQTSAFIKYGYNSTLNRLVYKVNTQSGEQIDLTLFESWAYASVGAYSWLFSITGNQTYLNCAEKTFNTYYERSLYNGVHVSQIDNSNNPVANSSYYFLGKNFDLPYGFFWLYYSTKNETVRAIFSDLLIKYLDDFKCQYGFATQRGANSSTYIDSAPALPVICRTYELSLSIYYTDALVNGSFATCHQSSYYFGPLWKVDNSMGMEQLIGS